MLISLLPLQLSVRRQSSQGGIAKEWLHGALSILQAVICSGNNISVTCQDRFHTPYRPAAPHSYDSSVLRPVCIALPNASGADGGASVACGSAAVLSCSTVDAGLHVYWR